VLRGNLSGANQNVVRPFFWIGYAVIRAAAHGDGETIQRDNFSAAIITAYRDSAIHGGVFAADHQAGRFDNILPKYATAYGSVEEVVVLGGGHCLPCTGVTKKLAIPPIHDGVGSPAVSTILQWFHCHYPFLPGLTAPGGP
jgi:hypothetical protein